MAERQPERPEATIRRILVALDASADSLAALEAAGDLAAALHAELQGLFVEDLNLVRLTGLPFSTEIDLLSGEPRRLAAEDVERHLKRQAERARRSLERVAKRVRVRWTFRTVRGRVGAELLATETDLITVGARGHSPRRGPGSTAEEVLARAAAPVLLLRRGARLGPAVYALHDGTPAAGTGIAIAAEIARRHGSAVTVLAGGADEDVQRRLREELAERGVLARVEPLPSREPRELADLLRRRGCGLLVVPRTPGRATEPGDLARRLPCPVLVVS